MKKRSNICSAENAGFTLRDQQQSKDGKIVYKYTQTIAGYPVEFSSWHIHEKNGKVIALNGDIIDINDFNALFSLSENEALQAALNYIGAELYMWMDEGEEQNLKLMLEDNEATYYPTGIKIITPVQPDIRKNKLTTAYKFNIYSIQPFDRKMVYVDAQTGEILFDLPLIHFEDVVGTAHTQYSGIQDINTFKNSPTEYILKDNTRGNGIRTLNCHMTTNYNNAWEFTDTDNIWNNVNPQLDEYATDAHFATMSTYDYYWNVHNRNSINGTGHQLWSYVHFNLVQAGYGNNINAFWDGQRMTYGDGSASQGITPLTTLDICGHEVSHGLTQFTAGLAYSYESGALNEAFSDIFGTTIEFYATPESADWLMGAQIGSAFRSMSNPKEYGQPNTYHGQNWYYGSGDNGGVHTNSGVLNYWFYLLCEGGTGVNDNGHAYQVAPIGMENAEQLAFKMLTEYLSSGSQYIDACNWGIFAASELFGGCTPEVQSVGDAFYAVGVLTSPFEGGVSVNFKASESLFCSTPATVSFTNKTFNGIDYLWDFGDGATSTETNPVHIYTEEGNYTVTLTVDGGECGSGAITKQNFIRISSSFVCPFNMMHNQTLTKEGCVGVFYDSGGPNGNYPANSNSTLIIHAPDANGIVLTIEEFDIEPGSGSTCNYDYIEFHDGNSTGAPLINSTRYCNTTGNPGTISSTGEYITIFFHSDQGVELSGYKIFFDCLGMPTPPVANFSVNTETTCLGLIEFTDKSTKSPTEWLWDFGDGNTSDEQNPVHQYTETGTYTISLTVTNEFGTDHIQKIDLITFDIPEAPEIKELIVCEDEEFEIVLDWEGTAHWYEDITDEEPVYIGNTWAHPAITESRTYFVREVTEIPEGNCVSSFTEALIIPEICVSISQNQLEKITVLPNPTTGELRVTSYELQVTSIEIYDVYGKRQKAESRKHENGIIMDISDFSAGIYFLRITTKNGVVTQKVVKQ